jgi:hypothetical protein
VDRSDLGRSVGEYLPTYFQCPDHQNANQMIFSQWDAILVAFSFANHISSVLYVNIISEVTHAPSRRRSDRLSSDSS